MSEDRSEEWQVLISRQAERVKRRLDKPLRKRLDKAIQGLAQDPYPSNSRKLVGYENYYRLRVGNWRVIYTVRKQRLIVLVIKIAPRGQAYKN